MADALVTVVFKDGSRQFTRYCSTSDVVCAPMFKAADDAFCAYSAFDRQCNCGGNPERCVIHSAYGAGVWWFGLACRRCAVIVAPRAPFEHDIEIRSASEPPHYAVLLDPKSLRWLDKSRGILYPDRTATCPHCGQEINAQFVGENGLLHGGTPREAPPASPVVSQHN